MPALSGHFFVSIPTQHAHSMMQRSRCAISGDAHTAQSRALSPRSGVNCTSALKFGCRRHEFDTVIAERICNPDGQSAAAYARRVQQLAFRCVAIQLKLGNRGRTRWCRNLDCRTGHGQGMHPAVGWQDLLRSFYTYLVLNRNLIRGRACRRSGIYPCGNCNQPS